MRRPIVEIAIDRLAVDGVARRDGAVLRRAIERELARQLTAPGAAIVPHGLRNPSRVDAGTTSVSPTAGPQTFGRAIAERLAGGLRPGGLKR